MSGDVQPRRRRDKKKKKEEQIEETIVLPQPIPPTPILNTDDINIHVHKESNLGGGVCAKCIFFVLMIAISIIIGFTITEHRGQTDVELPASESRFASIFEGWVDKSIDTHDDGHEGHSEEISEDEEHDEHESEEEEDESVASEEEEEEEEEAEIEESEQEDEVTEEDESEAEYDSQQDNESKDDTEEEEEIGSEEATESQEGQREESEEDQAEESEEDQAEESEEDQAEVSEEDQAEEEEDVEAEGSEQVERNDSEEQADDDDVKDNDSEEVTQDLNYEKNDKDVQNDEETEKPEDDQDVDAAIEENSELTTAGSIKTGADNGAESESDDDRKVHAKAKSGAQSAYEFENITNADDYIIRDELDKAQRLTADNIQLSLSLFTKTLEKHPNSPRALYGKAQALDLWADKKRSNEILQESIQSYAQVLNVDSTPDALFFTAGERCINRMRFIGNYGRAVNIHKKLTERFPNESKYKNDLAVTYLTVNRISEARSLLSGILKKWPNDGFALVHYGFILKTVDNELSTAVDYLRRGIKTKEPGVVDGRFYFHLGDALARLGKQDEAMKIYEDGVENKVFLSKYQRSLYNVDRLTGRPWWMKEQTPYARLYQQLEQHHRKIRDEALAVLNKKGQFKDETENLRDVGDWKQFELYARGVKHVENCKRCPLTCRLIDSETDVKGCRRGQVKFSVMHPGTHVWPHCGPTNCRLRIHLGLKVPPKTYIRVAETTRTWEEGKILIFDDSFEHEVWHNGTEFRLVLIVDAWHPELTKTEKHNLSAI